MTILFTKFAEIQTPFFGESEQWTAAKHGLEIGQFALEIVPQTTNGEYEHVEDIFLNKIHACDNNQKRFHRVMRPIMRRIFQNKHKENIPRSRRKRRLPSRWNCEKNTQQNCTYNTPICSPHSTWQVVYHWFQSMRWWLHNQARKMLRPPASKPLAAMLETTDAWGSRRRRDVIWRGSSTELRDWSVEQDPAQQTNHWVLLSKGLCPTGLNDWSVQDRYKYLDGQPPGNTGCCNLLYFLHFLHIWRYPLTCLVHALLKQSLSSHSQPFLFHVDSTFTQIHFLHMTWDVAGWLGMDQNSLRYKWRLFNAFHRLRPHHVEYTGSRPITVVKQRRARSVLGWVTTWEYRVL